MFSLSRWVMWPFRSLVALALFISALPLILLACALLLIYVTSPMMGHSLRALTR